ncbi:hypothetical protein EVAR_98421_1 [Eumeta japonica]|uniref:Uncharacterized protein n=1 Tax=Eumeta variegata TaxID=151549 RepID=A0A4C2A6K4_EUMVA|nr:hypothetical protein EVAR_98421_1 [Eumeta japonica]
MLNQNKKTTTRSSFAARTTRVYKATRCLTDHQVGSNLPQGIMKVALILAFVVMAAGATASREARSPGGGGWQGKEANGGGGVDLARSAGGYGGGFRSGGGGGRLGRFRQSRSGSGSWEALDPVPALAGLGRRPPFRGALEQRQRRQRRRRRLAVRFLVKETKRSIPYLKLPSSACPWFC